MIYIIYDSIYSKLIIICHHYYHYYMSRYIKDRKYNGI